MLILAAGSIGPAPVTRFTRTFLCGVLGAAAMAAFLVAFAPAAGAADRGTTTVVDLPTRDATQRILYVRAADPVANLVFLPGHIGHLGIEPDGSMPTIVGRCAPLARARDAFAARGISVALVDRTSDGQVRQFVDVREVVRYLRTNDDLPTWIVGGSASTVAALTIAADLPADVPLGVVVFSPNIPDPKVALRVKRPVLVVYHRDDPPVLPMASLLWDALASAPARERIELSGGSNEGCGHHLFAGIDGPFVEAVAGFILRNNPPRR